jgi:hypothetical protein
MTVPDWKSLNKPTELRNVPRARDSNVQEVQKATDMGSPHPSDISQSKVEFIIFISHLASCSFPFMVSVNNIQWNKSALTLMTKIMHYNNIHKRQDNEIDDNKRVHENPQRLIREL